MNDDVAKKFALGRVIHLLAVIALYVSVYGALSLLFQFTNLALPDPLDRQIDVRDYIRYGVSMVIVFFPVYWWAWRSIEADLTANPGKRRQWVMGAHLPHVPDTLSRRIGGTRRLGLLVLLPDERRSDFAISVEGCCSSGRRGRGTGFLR